LRVGLPPRHLPLSEFLTLSAVLSHRRLVALFHATTTHRLQASRAFPAQPAVTPFGVRYSRAVRVELCRACAWLDSRPRLQSVAPTTRPTPSGGLLTCWRAAALLAFLPFEVYRTMPRDRDPPLTRFDESLAPHRSTDGRFNCASGYYDIAWEQLRRVAPTSMRFATSSDLSSSRHERTRDARKTGNGAAATEKPRPL
jgi:hypothetical protein